MSYYFSVYFLVVFKAVLSGLWTFGFIGLKIVSWVLFVELGGLLTPSVTRLFIVTSHLVKTLITSLRAQVISSSFPSCLLPLPLASLYPGTQSSKQGETKMIQCHEVALYQSRQSKTDKTQINLAGYI